MWDTDGIAATDDVAIPDAWDEGEQTTDDVYNMANEGSMTGGEEADSLPELVSGGEDSSEDSGYDFLNTPTNKEVKDFEAATEEKPKEVRDIHSENEEEQLEESINLILNIEDLNYKVPEPCMGLC